MKTKIHVLIIMAFLTDFMFLVQKVKKTSRLDINNICPAKSNSCYFEQICAVNSKKIKIPKIGAREHWGNYINCSPFKIPVVRWTQNKQKRGHVLIGKSRILLSFCCFFWKPICFPNSTETFFCVCFVNVMAVYYRGNSYFYKLFKILILERGKILKKC